MRISTTQVQNAADRVRDDAAIAAAAAGALEGLPALLAPVSAGESVAPAVNSFAAVWQDVFDALRTEMTLLAERVQLGATTVDLAEQRIAASMSGLAQAV